jgi:hypothetical protein
MGRAKPRAAPAKRPSLLAIEIPEVLSKGLLVFLWSVEEMKVMALTLERGCARSTASPLESFHTSSEVRLTPFDISSQP